MCSASRPRRSTRSRWTRPWSAAGSCTRVRRSLLGLLILAGLAPAAAPAHELGTIRVVARFERAGTYQIDAIVDREHLPPGFDQGGKIDPRWRPVGNLTPELEAKLGGLIAHAINGVVIAFDGKPAAPKVEVVLHPAGPAETAVAAELTLRFSGEIPGGAKTFTWRNDVKLGS